MQTEARNWRLSASFATARRLSRTAFSPGETFVKYQEFFPSFKSFPAEAAVIFKLYISSEALLFRKEAVRCSLLPASSVFPDRLQVSRSILGWWMIFSVSGIPPPPPCSPPPPAGSSPPMTTTSLSSFSGILTNRRYSRVTFSPFSV